MKNLIKDIGTINLLGFAVVTSFILPLLYLVSNDVFDHFGWDKEESRIFQQSSDKKRQCSNSLNKISNKFHKIAQRITLGLNVL